MPRGHRGCYEQALVNQPCQVFSSDLRIAVAETGLATYSDVSVVCGHIELDPEDRKGPTVTNPTLVVHAGQAVELESLHGIRLPVDDVYFDPLVAR